MILSRIMLKRVVIVDIPVEPQLLSEPVSYAAVIEVFDDSDKVGADIVLLHGCP